ncbi:MAG: hypothetical protein J6V84_01620 [Clostridia bacterium]|nr:hypothetical protein [Clostridia bacterium]
MIELYMPFLLENELVVAVDVIREYPSDTLNKVLCYKVFDVENGYFFSGKPFIVNGSDLKNVAPINIKCQKCLFCKTDKLNDRKISDDLACVEKTCSQRQIKLYKRSLPFNENCKLFRNAENPYIKTAYNDCDMLLSTILKDINVSEFEINSESRKITFLGGHLSGPVYEEEFEEFLTYPDEEIIVFKHYFSICESKKLESFSIRKSDFDYLFYMHELTDSDYNMFVFVESKKAVVCHYEMIYLLEIE